MYSKKILSLFVYLLSFSLLFSQTIGPVIVQEKRPTTRDPSYQPSITPFFLKKRIQQNPIESFILNPNLSIDEFLRSKQETISIPFPISSEEEFLLKHLSDKEIRKYYFEKYFLPQVGIDKEIYKISYEYIPNEFEPKESKWERRFTIFMLSFPITTGISYGIFRIHKANRNLPSSLNKEETFNLFILGILGAISIVYYDENYFHYIKTYSKYLQKEKLLSNNTK